MQTLPDIGLGDRASRVSDPRSSYSDAYPQHHGRARTEVDPGKVMSQSEARANHDHNQQKEAIRIDGIPIKTEGVSGLVVGLSPVASRIAKRRFESKDCFGPATGPDEVEPGGTTVLF